MKPAAEIYHAPTGSFRNVFAKTKKELFAQIRGAMAELIDPNIRKVKDRFFKNSDRFDREPAYVVKPGHVISQADGQSHFVSYTKLISLYGVDPKLCVMYKSLRWDMMKASHKLMELVPQEDGIYALGRCRLV